MVKLKNKDKKKEAIIEHIKKETINGEPIILRSIDVSNIFKIPQSTCIRLLREVKNDERIMSEPILPGKSKSSPRAYIHLDNVNNKKEKEEVKEQEKPQQTAKQKIIKLNEQNKEDVKINASNALCDNLSKFTEYIENFKGFITETADFIKNGESSNALRNNLEQSKDVIEKFLNENAVLRERITKLKKEKEDMAKYITALKDCNDNVIGYMQQRLQIVIVEITNQSKEYVNTPKWQINNAFDARFEKIIINIITTAIDDIIENNTNIKAE